MAHLAGIDKGPVLDWTDDNGLMEHFRKWKKKVEILFRGPLNAAGDESSATTSSIGQEKQTWSWWIYGKQKERSLRPIGTTLQGILRFLKNTFCLNPML